MKIEVQWKKCNIKPPNNGAAAGAKVIIIATNDKALAAPSAPKTSRAIARVIVGPTHAPIPWSTRKNIT